MQILMPEHPNAQPSTGYVYEHILVASKALGNAIPPLAKVHHVDGDPANNANSNLVICQDHEYHMLLHRRARALKACGNPNWVVCEICGKHGDPATMWVQERKAGIRAHHYGVPCNP